MWNLASVIAIKLALKSAFNYYASRGKLQLAYLFPFRILYGKGIPLRQPLACAGTGNLLSTHGCLLALGQPGVCFEIEKILRKGDRPHSSGRVRTQCIRLFSLLISCI